jgi:hypothetical protein
MFAAAFSSTSPIHGQGGGQGGKVQNQTGVGKVQAPTVITRQKTVDERLKKELLRVLLEVYMDGDEWVFNFDLSEGKDRVLTPFRFVPFL